MRRFRGPGQEAADRLQEGPGRGPRPRGSWEGLTVVPRAGVAVLDRQGRVLLGRRSDDRTWCLPGGKLDEGESFRDCAIREFREETGWDVGIDSVVAVLSSPETQRHTYPDGRVVQFVGVVFGGSLGPAVMASDGELEETGWFGREDLESIVVMRADRPAIEHALSGATAPLID